MASATTCASPSSTGSSRCAARACSLVPSAFTLATTRDHWEVLLRARAIEDQCFVVAANQIGEHGAGKALRRALADRRSVGRGARTGAGQRELSRSPSSTSRGRTRSARRLPSLANRRAEAYRGPSVEAGDAAAQVRAGRRQTAHDPRRRGARLRAPGLLPLPGLGHRRRSGRRLRARLPLLPVQGRDPRHDLPRALGRHAAR